MNAFADSLLSVLLGWVRNGVRMIFDFFVSPSSGGFYVWLGDHWLTVVILICLAGTVIDFAVWMKRYRPFAKAEREMKKRRHAARKLLSEPEYAGAVELGFEVNSIPAAEKNADYFDQEPEARPRPEFEPAMHQNENAYYDSEPAGDLPVVRKRRTDRYRTDRYTSESMLGKLKRTLVDGDYPDMSAPDAEKNYHEPVYPQSEGSEWQQWRENKG